MEIGARPGGNWAVTLTGPPSMDARGGDERRESRFVALALPLVSAVRIGEKLGMAVWLMEGWLWKRTKMW